MRYIVRGYSAADALLYRALCSALGKKGMTPHLSPIGLKHLLVSYSLLVSALFNTQTWYSDLLSPLCAVPSALLSACECDTGSLCSTGLGALTIGFASAFLRAAKQHVQL